MNFGQIAVGCWLLLTGCRMILDRPGSKGVDNFKPVGGNPFGRANMVCVKAAVSPETG